MHCYRVNPRFGRRFGRHPTARDLTCHGPSSCTCRCDDCHEQRMEDLREARDKLRAAERLAQEALTVCREAVFQCEGKEGKDGLSPEEVAEQFRYADAYDLASMLMALRRMALSVLTSANDPVTLRRRSWSDE